MRKWLAILALGIFLLGLLGTGIAAYAGDEGGDVATGGNPGAEGHHSGNDGGSVDHARSH